MPNKVSLVLPKPSVRKGDFSAVTYVCFIVTVAVWTQLNLFLNTIMEFYTLQFNIPFPFFFVAHLFKTLIRIKGHCINVSLLSWKNCVLLFAFNTPLKPTHTEGVVLFSAFHQHSVTRKMLWWQYPASFLNNIVESKFFNFACVYPGGHRTYNNM